MPKPSRPCGVADCDRKAEWLGYCGKHAWRFKKYGDPLHVTRPHEPQSTCTVEGCDTKARSRGMCIKHLTRWANHGDVNYNERPQCGTDDITYGGAHHRVRRARGLARDQVCVDCSQPADHWSYNHTDPDAKIDPDSGLPYSPDPAHYSPRCTECHKRFDLGPQVEQICSIPGCGKPVNCRGWCKNHYYRWSRDGDPLGVAAGTQPK